MTNKNPGCLDSILGLFSSKPKSSDKVVMNLPSDEEEEDNFPYRLRDDFLSPAEHSFYMVLKSMMGEHFTIYPKVSLADIFYVVKPNENMSAYNKINRKHVDFLICEPKTIQPLFAIELDDSSHQRVDRVERDDFVGNVFDAADLPLIHIPVRASYNTQELGQLFRQALQKETLVQPKAQATTTSANQAPTCPKCGIPMTVRKATRGSNAGQQFWGCTNYPRCHEVIPISD